jgi:hypothetical protein
MSLHRVSGLHLASDFPLPELPRSRAAAAPDLCCRLLPPLRRLPAPRAWLHRWREAPGPARICLGRTARGYLLRFAGLADFLVSRDGRSIRCRPRPRVPVLTLRHLLLDQVLPLVLGHRGRLVLHASAVSTAGGVVAFAGKTGWGKSTLCAGLGSAGLPVLADDCVVVAERHGRIVALPSYPGVRLRPDVAQVLGRGTIAGGLVAAHGDKRRHQLRRQPRHRASPARLLAVYVLTPPGASPRIRIARLAPREAVGRLLAHVHRLDVTDRGRLARELDALGRLAEGVRVFEVAYPRDLRQLARLCATVVRHATAQRHP